MLYSRALTRPETGCQGRGRVCDICVIALVLTPVGLLLAVWLQPHPPLSHAMEGCRVAGASAPLEESGKKHSHHRQQWVAPTLQLPLSTTTSRPGHTSLGIKFFCFYFYFIVVFALSPHIWLHH
ncbi:hypothetical protein TraAM80_09662 [Trypanosoma rangeli]|uniref:Uncharacterized protein n=1 Tax=Trypanosoma rangeli TaxID=5698 RepID=A0A3R7LZR7_TRYRA|nr:uncharacterized protein TraAM80_09662 [Trypanosoma rangeli]RNE96718.1 hypothetical protein TraAM80_09662 [Trypanosoma rangeli]|eukprot:RNE96718.1 hypothetical protein TraAM80_09662 [Trypanosoma rangeli]